jgi:1-acyl-sn-glycerol-3-phosphate acyltransferase
MLAGWVRNDWLFRGSLGTWSRGLIAVSGIKIEVIRAEGLKNQPCVFLPNHQAAFDIPIMSAVCLRTHDVRFMAKESLFRIPFLGWGIGGNGFIPIRRESAKQATSTFNEIIAKNNPAYSYIMFPEGTRSKDGHMLDFKRGAIGLVMKLKKPLVPVTIIDACRANPKNKLVIRKGTVRVIFHEPILPETWEGDERAKRDKLTKEIYETVAAPLPEDQKPVNAA